MRNFITSLEPELLLILPMLVLFLVPLFILFWHFYHMDEATLLSEMKEHPVDAQISDLG